MSARNAFGPNLRRIRLQRVDRGQRNLIEHGGKVGGRLSFRADHVFALEQRVRSKNRQRDSVAVSNDNSLVER